MLRSIFKLEDSQPKAKSPLLPFSSSSRLLSSRTRSPLSLRTTKKAALSICSTSNHLSRLVKKRRAFALFCLLLGAYCTFLHYRTLQASTLLVDEFESRRHHRPPKTKVWKTPVIKREQLYSKLQLFTEENYLPSIEEAAVAGQALQLSWPPAITYIPESGFFSQPLALSDSDFKGLTVETDLALCGTSPCRLLVPGWIIEQESKARQHLLQLLHLAEALNRTLVLPNVGKSRMGTCYNNPFEDYYDVTALAAEHLPSHAAYPNRASDSDGARRVVPLDHFTGWVRRRPKHPTSQAIAIEPFSTKRSALDIEFATEEHAQVIMRTIDQQADAWSTTHKNCLSTRTPLLQAGSFSSLTITPLQGGKRLLEDGSFARSLIYFLSSDTNSTSSAQFDPLGSAPGSETLAVQSLQVGDPDVLIVDWQLRYPIFAPTGSSGTGQKERDSNKLPYAQHLHALADALAMGLSEPRLQDNHGTNRTDTHVAVHWRIETVPPEVLPSCSRQLVETLRTQLPSTSSSFNDTVAGERHEAAKDVQLEDQDNKARAVWLASDYHLPGSSGTGSGTFHPDLDVEEDELNRAEAMNILHSAFHSEDGPLSQWKLTTLDQELTRLHLRLITEDQATGFDFAPIPRPGDLEAAQHRNLLERGLALSDDLGVRGILDKLVSLRAGVFVSGKEGSFTRQIIEERRRIKDASQSVRNIVQFFG